MVLDKIESNKDKKLDKSLEGLKLSIDESVMDLEVIPESKES